MSNFRVQKIIVFLLLIALPFSVAPIGPSQFETMKIILAEVGIEFLIFYSLIFLKQDGIVWKPFAIFVSALFVLTIYDLLFMRTDTTFFGNVFRLQGAFLLWHLIAFSIVSRKVTLERLPAKFISIPIVGLLISILIFGNNIAGRAIGTFGEPNFLAACAIFMWPFLISLREGEKHKKILITLAIFITTIILLLTKSHSAMIGFGLQLIFIGFTKVARIKLKTSLIICIFLLGISMVLPFITVRDPYEDRATIWQISFEAFVKKPIIGYGFGNVEEILKKKSIEGNTRLKDYYVDSAHNFLLDFLLSGGIIALSGLLLTIHHVLQTFAKQGSVRNICLLLGIMAVMLFNPVSVSELLAFWWIIGQGIKEKTTV